MNFLPQSPKFFNYFEELSLIAVKTSSLLPSKRNGKINWKRLALEAQKLEDKADNLCHKIYQAADKTFITPIDREDIQALAKNLDNVIDLIENAISHMYVYKVGRVPGDFYKFCAVINSATRELNHLVSDLKHKNQNAKEMRAHVVALHSWENKGDILLVNALNRLFSNNSSAIYVIKWKDIYENLEEVLDECEDTSDTVETIIVKNF